MAVSQRNGRFVSQSSLKSGKFKKNKSYVRGGIDSAQRTLRKPSKTPGIGRSTSRGPMRKGTKGLVKVR